MIVRMAVASMEPQGLSLLMITAGLLVAVLAYSSQKAWKIWRNTPRSYLAQLWTAAALLSLAGLFFMIGQTPDGLDFIVSIHTSPAVWNKGWLIVSALGLCFVVFGMCLWAFRVNDKTHKYVVVNDESTRTIDADSVKS